MSKFGIDVSAHNGTIDWDKVKSQIDFAILKMGNIGDGNKFWADNSFERNYNECIRLGIPVGVYVYSYTNQIENIDDCARDTLKYLNGRKLQLPIYIDMEDKEIAPEGKDKLTDLVITFNTIIEHAGYWAGVYANRNWYDNYLNKDIIKKKYTTWIATYTSGTDKYKGEYDIWQNSSKGKINGVNGNVDTNYMYRDLIAEIGNSKQSSKEEKQPAKIEKKYTVGKYKVTASLLNVRTGAGTNYKAKTYKELTANARAQNKKLGNEKANGYLKGVVCSVSMIQNNWGYTPSGWICLDYTKKV